MTTFKKILVCSDISTNADHALRRAAIVARDLSASCDVVYVVDSAPLMAFNEFGMGSAPIQDQLRLDAEKSLAAQIMRCWPPDLSAPNARVLDGSPVSCISEHVQQHGYDLVVIGSHGAGFLEQLFLGTTATRLIKRLTAPVLVVRKALQASYQRILVPVDFSDFSQATVAAVLGLCPSAFMILMHAFESLYEGQMVHAGVDESTIHRYRIAAQEEAASKMRQLAQRLNLNQERYHLHLSHGRAHKEILAAAQNQRADCIAIGKQGKGFVSELLLGSVTKHVLFESQADVLVKPLT